MVKDFVKNHFPDLMYAVVASLYYITHPNQKSKIIYPVGNCWRVIAHDNRYYTFKDSISRGTKKKQEIKYSRYTDEGFCQIETDDLVVDVGAFVGEFALPASRCAESVLAIEPDPQTFQCLSKQVSFHKNITAINKLPHETETTVSFKSADDGSESSLIDVDAGGFDEIKMTTVTLDGLLSEHGISQVDFLKMDAEGAEPEVLRGIENTPVEKFAIDVGAERKGGGTRADVIEVLEQQGYEYKIIPDQNNDPVLFAKYKK